MKVSELSGAQLDLAVARHDPVCSGLAWENRGDHWAGIADIKDTPTVCCFIRECDVLKILRMKIFYDAPEYSPSRNWAQGGPIIEREWIELRNMKPVWIAHWGKKWALYSEGGTPLEAAMRCYVASRFGDEVE